MRALLKKFFSLDILFIFILSLTPLLWFRGNSIMVGHDNVFPLDPAIFLSGRLYAWIEQGLGQSQALIMGTIPIHLIDALPSIFGFSLQVTQKIVYVFWFFMMGISAYILACTINKESRVFKLTAVILYQFNFFILQGWWVGERTKFSAYIAFPLILSVFLKVYKGELKVSKGVIYASLIFFLFNGGGLYGISLHGGFFIGLITFVLFFSVLNVLRKQYNVVKRLLLLTVFSFLGFLIVNAYYILPAFSKVTSQYTEGVEKAGGVSGFADWASEISANANYINLFRLQGIAEWYDNPQHPYAKYYLSNSILIALSFLWPLLIFLTVIIIKERKKLEIVLYLFLVYLLGIFFAAGTHPPLGFLYAFLIETIPGFVIFRSPFYKFAPAIFLANAFLIAFFLDYFKGWFKKIFFVAFVILVLAYHSPYFTANFFSWRTGFSTRLQIPEYVFQFGKWINTEKKDDERVFLLPPNNPNLQYSMYDWGYLSFQSLPTLLTNKSVIINNDRLSDGEQALINALYLAIVDRDKTMAMQLMSSLRIKYFVLQTDTIVDLKSPLPFDSSFYKQILENDFQLSIIATFGKWSVYKIDNENLPKFFSSANMEVLEGKVKDIIKYSDFSRNANIFVRKEDLPKEMLMPTRLISSFYIPAECLNCEPKDKPFIKIPERNILPDSPLYPLVLLNENRNLKNKDTKSLVYDYMGITLKRVGEIKEMTIANKKITDDVIDRYDALLKEIIINFSRLTKYEDKIQVANDIQFYLGNEHSALAELFGIYATQGDLVAKLDHFIQRITSVLNTVDPYLFKRDTVNNRLYQVLIGNSGNYELYLKTKDFLPLFKDGEKISLLIDSVLLKQIELDSNEINNKWLYFGEIQFNKGMHNIVLSFPKSPNVANGLKADKTEINTNNDINCYTTKINNFDNRKIYRAKITYRNDFSTDLFFYSWELMNSERRLMSAFRLKWGFVDEDFTKNIKTNANATGVLIGLCSRGLVKEAIEKKITVTVNEIITDPNFIVFSQSTPNIFSQRIQNTINEVKLKEIFPTKYLISFKSSSSASVLAFMERFDNGWVLSGFEKKHFRFNGYANGWLIDKTGDMNLVLEYKPQRMFIYGGILSVTLVLGGLIYLLVNRATKRRKDD